MEIRVTVLGGLLLTALAVIVITFISGSLLIVFGVLAGIGIGTGWTNSDSLVSDLAGGGQLGASMGAAQSFKEFARSLQASLAYHSPRFRPLQQQQAKQILMLLMLRPSFAGYIS